MAQMLRWFINMAIWLLLAINCQAKQQWIKTTSNHEPTTTTNNLLSANKVCCDIIYESDIDLRFFTELCKSVIEREMATEAGIRKYRQGKYPPPGMLERCRKKILQFCHLDISSALLNNEADKMSTQNKTQTPPKQLNISECLAKSLQRIHQQRRFQNQTSQPRHIRQERPSRVGSKPVNSALLERGSPFPNLIKTKDSFTNQTVIKSLSFNF